MPGDWNDKALDLLKERVDDHENEMDAMRGLPAEWGKKLVKLETHVGALLESSRDERKVNRDFRKETRTAFDETRKALDALTRERPDGTREAAPGRLGFSSWLAILATVVVPIVVAIILQGS